MVFSTSIFIYLFLPITLVIYYIAPKKSKNFIILLSGLVFYSWGEPIYVVVMLISTMIAYFAGLVMNHFEGKKLPRKLCLIVSVVMNLGLLGVFKYSGFIAENINAIAGSQIIDINNMNGIRIRFFSVRKHIEDFLQLRPPLLGKGRYAGQTDLTRPADKSGQAVP